MIHVGKNSRTRVSRSMPRWLALLLLLTATPHCADEPPGGSDDDTLAIPEGLGAVELGLTLDLGAASAAFTARFTATVEQGGAGLIQSWDIGDPSGLHVVFLTAGRYAITLELLDEEDLVIYTGTRAGVHITSGALTSLTIPLTPVGGSLQVHASLVTHGFKYSCSQTSTNTSTLGSFAPVIGWMGTERVEVVNNAPVRRYHVWTLKAGDANYVHHVSSDVSLTGFGQAGSFTTTNLKAVPNPSYPVNCNDVSVVGGEFVAVCTRNDLDVNMHLFSSTDGNTWKPLSDVKVSGAQVVLTKGSGTEIAYDYVNGCELLSDDTFTLLCAAFDAFIATSTSGTTSLREQHGFIAARESSPLAPMSLPTYKANGSSVSFVPDLLGSENGYAWQSTPERTPISVWREHGVYRFLVGNTNASGKVVSLSHAQSLDGETWDAWQPVDVALGTCAGYTDVDPFIGLASAWAHPAWFALSDGNTVVIHLAHSGANSSSVRGLLKLTSTD
jgi:hypothetical protein